MKTILISGGAGYFGTVLTQKLLKKNMTEGLPEELQRPDIDEDGNIFYSWVKGGVFNLEIQSNGEIWFELYSHYKHIKWVHELQNLYFALTGEELILQEK